MNMRPDDPYALSVGFSFDRSKLAVNSNCQFRDYEVLVLVSGPGGVKLTAANVAKLIGFAKRPHCAEFEEVLAKWKAERSVLERRRKRDMPCSRESIHRENRYGARR